MVVDKESHVHHHHLQAGQARPTVSTTAARSARKSVQTIITRRKGRTSTSISRVVGPLNLYRPPTTSAILKHNFIAPQSSSPLPFNPSFNGILSESWAQSDFHTDALEAGDKRQLEHDNSASNTFSNDTAIKRPRVCLYYSADFSYSDAVIRYRFFINGYCIAIHTLKK
jgi:hypothetical protein